MLKIGRIAVSIATMMVSGTAQAGTIFDEDFYHTSDGSTLGSAHRRICRQLGPWTSLARICSTARHPAEKRIPNCLLELPGAIPFPLFLSWGGIKFRGLSDGPERAYPQHSAYIEPVASHPQVYWLSDWR